MKQKKLFHEIPRPVAKVRISKMNAVLNNFYIVIELNVGKIILLQ